MFKKILKALPFIAVTAGLLIGGTAIAAHASTGNGYQFRAVALGGEPYMNAWGGGGGYVNAYQNQTLNNDFSIVGPYSNGLYEIEFTPGNCTVGSGSCLIIADYGNGQTDARAGTYTQGTQAPWGAFFSIGTCSVDGTQGNTFHNSHWNSWLSPNSGSNGAPFYLNSGVEYCYVPFGAY
jgi:hypothetical protein